MNKKITLRILKKVEKELLQRDRTFCNIFKSIGLCAMILHKVKDLYPNHPKVLQYCFNDDELIGYILPEFTREYCNKIATISPLAGGYWWPIINRSFIINENNYYDVESRLKVIQHFITLYSNKKGKPSNP